MILISEERNITEKMDNKEFFEALKMLAKEKKLSLELLCEGIERAIVTAVKRDYNNKDIVLSFEASSTNKSSQFW